MGTQTAVVTIFERFPDFLLTMFSTGSGIASIYQSHKSNKKLDEIENNLVKIRQLLSNKLQPEIYNTFNIHIDINGLEYSGSDEELRERIQFINKHIIESIKTSANKPVNMDENVLHFLKKPISGIPEADRIIIKHGTQPIPNNHSAPPWPQEPIPGHLWPTFRINEKKIITHAGLLPKLCITDTNKIVFHELPNIPPREKIFYIKENIEPFTIAPLSSETKFAYRPTSYQYKQESHPTSTSTLPAGPNEKNHKIPKQKELKLYKKYRRNYSNTKSGLPLKNVTKNAAEALYKIQIRAMINAIQQAKKVLKTKHEPTEQLSIIRECYSQKFKTLHAEDAKLLLELSLQLATILASSNNTNGIKYILRYIEYLLRIIK